MNLHARLRELHDALPEDGAVTLTRDALGRWLAEADEDDVEPEVQGPAPTEPESWRSKLWRVPAEVRIGVEELAEALGRPKSFVYDRTHKGASDPIPHAKAHGSLVFVVGQVRTWIRSQENVVHAAPMESAAEERGIRAV